MKKINDLQSYLTRLRGLMLTLIILCSIGVGNAWGDSYTITFSGSNSESTALSGTAASICGSSTYVTGDVSDVSKAYGPTSDGVKVGASSNAGTFTLSLSALGKVTPDSIVVNCKRYNSTKSATVNVNSIGAQDVPSSWGNVSFTTSTALTSLTIASSKYIWVKSVTVYYTSGGGSTPTISVTPISIDFGTVDIGNSPTETFVVKGSNLTGDITLTGASAPMSLSETTITKAEAETVSGKTITVTYTPTSTASTNQTITLASSGATNKSVSLAGQGQQKYAVHYFVGGAEDDNLKEMVVSGGKVSSLPSAESCDAVNYPYFVGWSTTNFGSTTSAPSLVTGNETISSETTYYAVFAAGEGGAPAVIFSDAMNIDGTSAVSSRTGWTDFSTAYGGSGSIRLSSGSNAGKMTKTAMGSLTSPATLKFKILHYGSETGKVSLSASKGTFSTTSFTASSSNDTWQEVSTTLTGGDNTTTITFTGTKDNRIYIKDISITSGGGIEYTKWITKCCESWVPPTLSYSVPGNWKAGDNDINATLGNGTTYGSTTWTSSDESVLTVNSSGQIHAVGAGTATVTVTWAGNATHCSQSRTSAAITVNGNVAVSFNANGGSLGITSQSVPYNTATNLTTFASLSGTAPNCKRFDHWNTAVDNSGISYTDGQSVTLKAGLTLYAIYSDITYAVSDGTMVGVGSHSYSANPITCGTTLTITCAADGDHKGNPTVTATGTHGAITVVSATSVTIANVTSAIAVSISYAEKTNVTATWHVNNGSVTGGGTTIQKEGSSFTFPNVTSTDCGTFLGWTNAANSGYNSTSGKPATFYNVGSTIVLNENTQFYAVYSKVGDNAEAGVLYHHEDTGADLADNDHKGVTVTGTGLDEYKIAPYIKFDGIGDNIIFELDGTPTSFYMQLKTMTGGSTPRNAGFTLYESDSKTGPWIAIGEEVTATGESQEFEINITTAQSFSKRVLKVEMTTRSINVGGGEITINGLRAPINYTTNPGCVDWVLDAINVTTAPTKTTYGECEEFDPAGMVVTATMKENGNPSNTTTKDVVGYTWTPTQFMTPGNSVAVTISYTEKAVTKTTTTNVRVNDLDNYTITFHDGGNTSTWTQSNHCEACDLDSRTGSLACGDYAFAGWSTSNTNYDDQSATITTWVSGNYTPTANTHLYAVYRKGAAPAEFSANCAGGTFTISEANGNTHMAGRVNATPRLYTTEYWNGDCGSCDGDDGTPFTFTKIADNTYKIQNSEGDYLRKYSSGNHPDFEGTWHDEDNFKWLISAGTNGTWRFTNKEADTYALVKTGSYFDFQLANNVTQGSSYYDLELSPVASTIYQSNPRCGGTYAITFDTHGGTFVQGNYAYPTETTDGLSDPTNSYFPSATMPGCTFVGWKEGSAQEDVTSGLPGGLFEGGAVLLVSSNKTYHAVYYYLDDDWEFDPVEGGTYHMYATVSETKYFCSGTPSKNPGTLTSTTNCASAVDVIITPGTEGNAGKYRINIGGYDITPELNGTGIKQGTFWWNINEVSENLYHITADGAESGRSFNFYKTGKAFTHYKDNGAGLASDISFGRCRQHHWTSDPVLMPRITLGSTGSLNVTSTNGKTVYAANKLTIEATRYGEQTKLYLFSDNANIGFRKGDGTALLMDGVGPYIQTDASGELATTNITITYTPNVSTDGIETATITVRDNTSPSVQASATRVIKARHLPTDFVIAAKNTSNNKWYALPADMGGTGNPTPVEISVDDMNNPSIAYTATSNIYNLYSNGTPQYVQLGMKNNVDGSGRSYALWANNSQSSNDIGKNQGLAQNALGGNFQWLLTQTNGNISTPQEAKYTISNPNNANALKAWFAADGGPKWGLYVNGVDELRLIAASNVVPTEAYFVEWGQHGGVIEVDAQGVSATKVKAKLNGEESEKVKLSQTLTSVKNRASVYNYTVNFGNVIDFSAAASAGAMLTLEWYTSNDVLAAVSNISVPRIIATSGTMSTIESRDTYWTTTNGPTNEVHVLPGAVLTADAGAFGNNDVTIPVLEIYQGATVKVTSGTLDVDTLVLRNGWSRAGEKRYDVARLHIATTANLTTEANHVYADWYIDYDQYYPVAVPWDVTLANIRYRYCSVSPTIGYDQNIRLRYYDGDARAKGSGTESNWKDFGKSGNIAMPTKIVPAHGYAITAKRPSGKAFSILRMPLTIPSNSWTALGEQGVVSNTHKDTVHVIAHRYEKTPWYAMGWNFVANPYMCTFNSAGDESITGNLSTQNGGSVRYATIPDVDFQNFEQVNIATADLKPSSGFLVQVGTTGALTFNKAKIVVPTAPARYMAEQESIAEQEVYVLLSNDGGRDQMGLIIGSDYTEAYEVNADLSKMLGESNTLKTWMRYTDMDMAYVAINEDLAREWIPVTVNIPAKGEYTYSMLNSSIVDELEGVYLIDYKTGKTTNLIYDDYTFSSEAGTDSGRFAIHAIVGKHNVPTGADLTESERNSNSPVKFIWQDKVYILHNNAIYDSTGKQVNVINK